MKTSALIPEHDLLLQSSIEDGVSQEALAKENKKVPDKRKGGSLCLQYYRTRKRIRSKSVNSPHLCFFDRCSNFQDHVTLNHEAEVGDDAMFNDRLANNLVSIATTGLVDKSADGCHESIQNDYINGSMREDKLYKLTENISQLLTDNLRDFFDTGIELKDGMHKGDSDNSSAVTEVEYASLPDSLLSSNEDYILCILSTEDTIDDIPNSQLLDSPENVVENSSSSGDQQDGCHWEVDVESTSISHVDSVQLTCILNTEDLEIPCNDNNLLLVYPSPSVTPQTATDSIDPASSFTRSQINGLDLSSEFDSTNPHAGYTLRSVSVDHNPSISDHNNSDSDSDLHHAPDIVVPEIPCVDSIFSPSHPSPSVIPQTSTESIAPASSFTESQTDGPDLSSEFPENVLEDSSFSGDQQDVCHWEADVESTSISHVDSVQLTCILNTEDLEIPCNDNILLLVRPSPSVIPQIATDSIDPASSFTQSQIYGPDLISEFDSANPHDGYTLKSVSMDRNPSISDHNNSDSGSDLHRVPDIEDPEIRCIDNIFLQSHPSPSVRPQTDTNLIDLAPSFTQSQMDGPDLSSEFDSAYPHVGNNIRAVSMDGDHSISDHNNPDSDSDLPCLPDIENPEIPCNDNKLLLIHPSPSVGTQIPTDSIDPTSSFTPSQMDGPDLSSEFDSASPHDGNNLKTVSTDFDHSISDHSNPDSDIENPEIPCNGNRLLLIHPSPSIRTQIATDSIDPTSSFTRLQMDDPDLSFEFDSAHPHAGNTLKSVSMDHNPSILAHYNSDCENDLPCFPDIEALILKLDIEFAQESSITNEVKRHKYEHSEWTINRPEQSLQRAMSSLLIHPSPAVRSQIVTDSIDPASSFSQLQMDDPDLSFESDAHPNADNTLKSVSMDHNPSISDHNNSDCENDLPCLPDIEALILKLDFEYAQESWITNEVKRHKYEHTKWTINRPEQSLHRAMSSLGAFAVFSSGHFNYYIKKTEVTIGRSTDDNIEVDIDLRKESHANMISRQQATIKMDMDGTFTLKNIGKGSILMNGESISHGQVAALGSSCLIQIRGMNFMFEVNDNYVRCYLDNIIKKTQGKFTTFEWSMGSCG